MNFLTLISELSQSNRGRTRLDPKAVADALMKLAAEDPAIDVTEMMDTHGEIKGHTFKHQGHVVTTRFDVPEMEGTVGIIYPGEGLPLHSNEMTRRR